MAVIKVPRTPKRAFNKRRRVSDLLRRQIEHLEWASHPASERKPGMLQAARIRTEGEAAERIAQLTVAVREQALRDAAAGAVPPHDATAVPATTPPVAADAAAASTTLPSRRRRSPASSRGGAATRKKKRSVTRRPSSRKRAATGRQRKRKK